MASMTGIFISKEYGADVSRIAAQVVSGIGFLGAGTILVRNRSTVTGLTTAASIWATGTLGLAVGFGFYGAAILCALLILFIAGLLGNVDRRLSRRPREFNVYAEFSDSSRLNETLERFGEAGFEVLNIHLTSPKTNLPAGVGADMVIRLNRRLGAKEAVDMLRKTENVHLIIEE